MKQQLAVIRRAWIVFLLAAGVVSAQTTPPQQTTPPSQSGSSQSGSGSAEQEVRAAQQQFLEAARNHDMDAARRFMAEDLTWVNSTGTVATRDALLGTTPTPPKQVTIERVLAFGDTAIVTSTAQLQNGTEARAIQEWVKRDGQWQLLAHQGTTIAPAGGQAGGAPPAVAGTSGVGSAMHASPPALNSDEEREVWKAQMDLHKAFLAGDTATYSKLTSDDYLRVAGDGKQQGKSEFLETVKRNAKQSPGSLETGDVQVKVNGDTARVLMTTWGTLPGGQPEPPQRVTRVFVRRSGQWQQLAAIFTPIAQQ